MEDAHLSGCKWSGNSLLVLVYLVYLNQLYLLLSEFELMLLVFPIIDCIYVDIRYCMRTVLEKRVDDWHCQECEKANQLEVCKGGELRVESRKLPNESRVGAGGWEKMAPTGKTKYLSVKETLMLASGEKKYFPSSSITNHSKPSQQKSGMSRLDRATIKPRVLLNFSSHQNIALETLRPLKPQRPGNVEIRVKKLQQSKKLTGD